METRVCKKCGVAQPLDKDHFGHMPSGKHRWECRSCIRKKVALHSKANPDKVKNRMTQRGERVRKNNSTPLTPVEREATKIKLHAKQNGLCFFCKKSFLPAQGELEHKIPVVKGGSDKVGNLIFACIKCNREKHNKTLEEYRRWLQKNEYEVLF